MFVAPHPLVEREEDVVAARARRDIVRGPLHASGDEVLVCVAGDLNATKGIEETLQALALVDRPIHLLLLGRPSPHWDFEEALRGSGQAGRVTIKPDVPDEEFLEWLCASDIVVNLRHPHRGEASGSLLRALQAGVVSIVSGVGTYLDWPEDVVVRVRPGPPDPVELARKLTVLADDPAMRRTYGERGRAFALETCKPERTAVVYEQAIGHALRRGTSPLPWAVARWGEALAECGATLEVLERGYGSRFADGLDDLLAAEPAAALGNEV